MINLYTNSTIGSYTTGTVTCTNNSDVVTGTGTTWSEIVNPGDILTLDDDKLYVIKTVNSNTSITLDKVFAESTVSNSAYRIFLNTAAHFPSDTAAKVERALEQLSDINEAAINNDRTVTAATKIEGKGLTSTAGTIDLNPPTVNSNTGGQINFHYNQSANATSSIVENTSGQIRVYGDLEVVHTVTGYEPISTANGNNFRVTRPLNTEIRPITNYNGAQRYDMPLVYVNATDGKVLSSVYTPFKFTSSSNYSNSIQLLAYNPLVENAFEMLGIGYNQNGVYTFAPTPAATDNSIKIATTAFVNNRLPYTTGTWTPVLKGATTAGELTYTSRSGSYIKIGRYVFIQGTIIFKGYTTHPVGSVQIAGLPFTSNGISYLTMGGIGTAGFYRLIRAFTENNSVLNCQLCKLSGTGVPDFDTAIFDTSRDTERYIQLNTTDTVTVKVSGVYIVA